MDLCRSLELLNFTKRMVFDTHCVLYERFDCAKVLFFVLAKVLDQTERNFVTCFVLLHILCWCEFLLEVSQQDTLLMQNKKTNRSYYVKFDYQSL